MKKVLKIVGIYILIYALCTILFVGLFHTELFASMDVLMYRGIIFIILTGIIAALLTFLVSRKWKSLDMDIKDVLLMFCGFCCVNMVLFTLIPVTVERSVSVFMLSYMQENEGEAYTQEEMSEIFIDRYVYDFGAFEKRFNEQIVSGNIEETEDGYVITDSGKMIVKMFRTVAEWFDTDRRIVYPMEAYGNE